MSETKANTPAEQPDYIGHRQRLRTRFLATEGKDMPDYEFLEFLLTMSIPRRDVKPLAKRLIKKFGSFAGVINAENKELLAFPGIKESSLALLKAVREATLRVQWQNLNAEDGHLLNNWDLVVDYCRSKIGYGKIEQFMIVYLNSKLILLGDEIQQRGSLNHVSIHPREVIKSAIERGAGAIVIAHNHPSGIVKPSQQDIAVTKMIWEAGKIVDVDLLDHLIVSGDAVYSFAKEGLLPTLGQSRTPIPKRMPKG